MLSTEARTLVRRSARVSYAFPHLGRIATEADSLAFIHEHVPGLDTAAELSAAVLIMCDAAELPFTWGMAHTHAVAGHQNMGVTQDVAFAAVFNSELGTGWQDAFAEGRLADLYPAEEA